MSAYRTVKESQTLLINQQSMLLEGSGNTIFKFGFGQSPFLPPKSVLEAVRNNVHRKDYTSVQGDEELRLHVSRFHQQINGIQSNKEDILIAPGSKIILYTILLSHLKADVLLAAPSWVSYAPQVELAGHKLIRIPTTAEGRWRITGSAIKEALKHKVHHETIIIINYPGNPDGLSYDKDELREIATVCRANDILVIADEIYGLLSFGCPHHSFAKFYPEKTITTTGLSKWCGAGGWRLGAAILPSDIDPQFKKALIGIGSETYSCAPTPIQIAAKEAYGNIEMSKAYIGRQCLILKEIATYCFEQLKALPINIHPSQGGFYLFPDFSNLSALLRIRNITNSEELCSRLLKETGVALLPGTAFGMDAKRMVVRLSFVDFKDPLDLPDFDLQRDCPKIIEGMEKLTGWFAT